jgi:RNAse (barnase) inhibitor barstar
MSADQGTALDALLADAGSAGAYFAAPHDGDALADTAAQLQYATLRIDLRDCDDSETAIARIAETLRFPEWFGGNWDAMADCLNDLSWLPAAGYLLLMEHADAWREADAEGFTTWLEIADEAAERWRTQRRAFWCVVLGAP